MKKLFFSGLVALFFFTCSVSASYAVPVRTYGGVNANTGNYYLQSDSSGNGDLTPGSSVTVDSYVFQCKSHGTAACSTEWNSDATLVQKFQNAVTVPNLNQRTDQVTHSFSLPYGQCGRVQYDQGIVGIPGAVGGWVYDFGQDCQNTTATQSTPSCSDQQPVLIQFRQATTGNWQSGSSLSSHLSLNQAIDVNCFAKSGTALLDGGYITATLPNGQTQQVSNTAEARNYFLTQAGNYTFTCNSSTMSSCTSADNLYVNVAPTPTPIPTPAPQNLSCSQACTPGYSTCANGLSCINGMCRNPSCSDRSDCSCAVTPVQQSSCDSLQVTSGNNATVPAHVSFHVNASDNFGAIKTYRIYFGDGQQLDSSSPDIQHDYNLSGTFSVQANIQDSQGNWKTSSACQNTVYVQSSALESAQSGCSNLLVTADNSGVAPSTVTFNVTGYDNKGSLQAYRVDFGNGVVKDSQGSSFQQIYTQPGTYDVYGYIKDSSGNWQGGTYACHQVLTITSAHPLTVQPSTGIPTAVPLIGLGSGAVGVALQIIKKKIFSVA